MPLKFSSNTNIEFGAVYARITNIEFGAVYARIPLWSMPNWV